MFWYVVACGCLRLLVVVTCFGVCYCFCWCCSLQFAVVVVFVGGRACHGLHCPQIMHKYGDNSASLLHAAVYAELQLCCCACHVRARQHNTSWPHENDCNVRSLAMMSHSFGGTRCPWKRPVPKALALATRVNCPWTRSEPTSPQRAQLHLKQIVLDA